MAVRFILGRSGTGKTRYCIDAIVKTLLEGDDGHSLLLLVPEQATYQAERAILSAPAIVGYHRLGVLSFDRLAFLLAGRDTAKGELSRLGRQMIVERILRQQKENLKSFGRSVGKVGLSRQMAEVIEELHEQARTADDLEELLGQLVAENPNDSTALKFSDIALVYNEYIRTIESKFINPDTQLARTLRAVAEADFTKGARLWVDGFAGFTNSELAVLTELLRTAEQAHIALCLDPRRIELDRPQYNPQAASLFAPTERTYVELLERIRKCKIKLQEPVILDKPLRFTGSGELKHIEKNLFEPKAPKIKTAGKVRIVCAANARAEARFVARQVSELVRDKGYRYRDIAVIASNIDAYEHYIRAYFDDYGIPFFIDKRQALNQHPVVILLCTALDTIISGFSGSDIFSYLKTSLVPVDDYDIDLLENYCVAYGVGGNDWVGESDWRFAEPKDSQFDEERINGIRKAVAEPLLRLREALCPADEPQKKLSPREFTQVIFDFLEELGVRERIGRWIEQALESRDTATADEHRQFYDKFVDVFDELVEVFEDDELTCEDYTAILKAALSRLTLAFIPPRLDQVLVGSIERSRHPELKAVFVIGATAGQFPSPVSFGGILTDEDRQVAARQDFELGPTIRESLAQRQYLAYIALTRASEFLCVSYPAANAKGAAVARSEFVDSLENLFDGLDVEFAGAETPDIEQVRSKAELAEVLCRALGKADSTEEKNRKKLVGLLDAMVIDEELGGVALKVVDALNYENEAKLSSNVVGGLFGERVNSSASKLSTFAGCPYRHFARYILKLERRKEFRFEPLDLGRFYHEILDGLARRLKADGRDIALLQDKQLLEMVRSQVQQHIQTNAFISNFAGRSLHNKFLIHSAAEVLEDCVIELARMIRAGSFRPVLSEVGFGQVEDTAQTIGSFELKLPDGRTLSLDGKIDRLDLAEINGRKTAVIFDYKRRETSFKWSDFYHGLDMQLPIYILAAANADKKICDEVAGAFYIPVEVPPKKADYNHLQNSDEKFQRKAKGLFNGEYYRQLDGQADSRWNQFYNFSVTKDKEQYGDYGGSGALRPEDFEEILRFTEKKVRELVGEIVSGKIDIEPARWGTETACNNCEYRAVCRFDWQVNSYRELASPGKSEVLEEIRR